VSIHPQVRIVVKPYGSALPLGFFSFGIGLLLLRAKPGVLDQADAYWLIAFAIVIILLGIAAWWGSR